MNLILADATDLKQWADRRDAQALLPELLRRLVLATGGGPEHISFRSGDGVQLGGWDGTVNMTESSTFVAAGYSGWEASCDRDVKRKADDDYEKRSRDPLDLRPSESVFVFVTPHRWRNKENWATAKRAAGVWKDVIAYDGDDLATWLAASPAVHIWFSIAIGKHPRSAEDLESFCRTWSRVTHPPVADALLLAGRADEAHAVAQWALGPPGAISVQADTEDEAIAFVLAAMREIEETARSSVLARGVVVYDEPTWMQLAARGAPLMLVPKFRDRSRTAAAVTDGHHVVITIARNEPPQRDTIELPRPRRAAAAAALKTMGLPQERADELAPFARAGLNALRRQLAISAASLSPNWATNPQQRDVLPALLIGRWDEASAGDRAIVEELSRRSYDDYRAVLDDLSRAPDPPVRRQGSIWMICAKDDAWSFLHRLLNDRDLEIFEEIAFKTLGETNPKFELPMQNQWLAAVQGKVSRHSATIREGIADTVALLGATSELFVLATMRSGQSWADRIVRRILEQAVNVQHWASLGAQLRVLAEAAPSSFLDCAERFFHPPSELALQIFGDEDGVFSWSPHTELLWALELLAWSPQYLARAVLCLAGLASVDPGGRISNRPLRSLHEIFLPWHPGTATNVAGRIDVLDLVRKEYPGVSWDLLSGLLPSGHGISMPTAEPKRRDWTLADKSVLVADYNALVHAVAHRVREDVGTSGRRWKAVLESLTYARDGDFESTIERLSSLDPVEIEAGDRFEIWSSLRTFLSRNREFAEATWALPIERLQQIDEIYERMQPQNPLDRVAWLFDGSPHPPNCTETDWQKREEFIQLLRREAVESIADESGRQILELAEKVAFPRLVGFTLGRIRWEHANSLLVSTIGSEKPAWRDLAGGLLYGRTTVDGHVWILELRQLPDWAKWSPEQKADCFRELPFCAATWNELDQLESGVRDAYWGKIGYLGRGEITEDDRDRAATEFARCDRIAAAIRVLALYTRAQARPPQAGFALELLERVGQREDTDGEVHWGALAYEIAKLLDIAASPVDAPIERIAKLEWLFLRLLDDHRPPKVLHATLSRDPSLFIDIIKVVYKATNEEEAHEDSDHEQLLARLGYDLLDGWSILPGSSETGFDEAALATWIDQARDMATLADRSRVADRHIGNLLARAPHDPDGSWPLTAVRNVVERIHSDAIERGISTRIYNSRGITSRAIGEGGQQERDLAIKYQTYANALRDRWPRTSRLLNALADTYLREARNEDLAAELEDDELS